MIELKPFNCKYQVRLAAGRSHMAEGSTWISSSLLVTYAFAVIQQTNLFITQSDNYIHT